MTAGELPEPRTDAATEVRGIWTAIKWTGFGSFATAALLYGLMWLVDAHNLLVPTSWDPVGLNLAVLGAGLTLFSAAS